MAMLDGVGRFAASAGRALVLLALLALVREPAQATLMLVEFEGKITQGGFTGTSLSGATVNAAITGAVRGTLVVDLGLAPLVAQDPSVLPSSSFVTGTTDPTGPQWITGQIDFTQPAGLPSNTIPFPVPPVILQRLIPAPGSSVTKATQSLGLNWSTEPVGAQSFHLTMLISDQWETAAERQTKVVFLVLLTSSPQPFFTGPFSTLFEPNPVTGNGLFRSFDRTEDLTNPSAPAFGIQSTGENSLAFDLTSFKVSEIVEGAQVPEPASLGLMMLGGLAVVARRWRPAA